MAIKYDNMEYHLRQYEQVYRSTEVMVDWLERRGYFGISRCQSICDMACGGGG